jgi:tetratricopeptide (TPR) repeat protein
MEPEHYPLLLNGSLPEHAKERDVDHRVQRLQGFLAADPDNMALLGEIADIYLHAGEPMRARPMLERMSALQPDAAATLHRMATLLFQERRFEESLVFTGRILEAGGQHAAVRYQHALTLAHLERFDEAEALVATLVEEGAAIPELPHLYIRTLHHAGKVDEAIEYAGAYVRRSPQDTTAAGMLSMLFFDDDRLIDATLMAERALSAAPNNLDALVTLGFATLAFGDAAKAGEYFSRAIAINPRNGRAHLGLALGTMLQGDLPGGRSSLERAVACMPRHLGSRNALAWVQILQGDFDAAQRTLEQSLGIDRRFGETYGGLAVVAARRGQWSLAQELAEKAARLQPDGFAGRFARSLLLAQRGDQQQANALIDAMLKGMVMPTGGHLGDMVRRFTAPGGTPGAAPTTLH